MALGRVSCKAFCLGIQTFSYGECFEGNSQGLLFPFPCQSQVGHLYCKQLAGFLEIKAMKIQVLFKTEAAQEFLTLVHTHSTNLSNLSQKYFSQFVVPVIFSRFGVGSFHCNLFFLIDSQKDIDFFSSFYCYLRIECWLLSSLHGRGQATISVFLH